MPQCTVGELVRSYRLVAGSTQETFSRQCGVSLTTLAAIERDQRRPSARELAQIAKTFSREFLRTHAAA